MNKTLLIIVGLIVIAGAFYFISSDNPSDNVSLTSKNASSTTGTNTSAQSPAAGANSVVLTETSPGTSVTIQSAQLTQPGYVVIYRSDTDGTTHIVGHSNLLSAGTYSNLAITLSSPIATDQSVSAVLHKDDGDGNYEVPGADSFLGNGTLRITDDVDVVGAPMTEESPLLKSQVEAYLEDATTTPE